MSDSQEFDPSDEIERLKAIVRSQDAALAHWRRESDRDAGTIARLSRELDAAKKLGDYAGPIKLIDRHPFLVIEGNRFCGECGGGILHPIHRAADE